MRSINTADYTREIGNLIKNIALLHRARKKIGDNLSHEKYFILFLNL